MNGHTDGLFRAAALGLLFDEVAPVLAETTISGMNKPLTGSDGEER